MKKLLKFILGMLGPAAIVFLLLHAKAGLGPTWAAYACIFVLIYCTTTVAVKFFDAVEW